MHAFDALSGACFVSVHLDTEQVAHGADRLAMPGCFVGGPKSVISDTEFASCRWFP